MAGFTDSNKSNDGFVDLTELDCPCLEILLISEYHTRKEIFNSFFFFFLMHGVIRVSGGKVFKLTFLSMVQSAG